MCPHGILTLVRRGLPKHGLIFIRLSSRSSHCEVANLFLCFSYSCFLMNVTSSMTSYHPLLSKFISLMCFPCKYGNLSCSLLLKVQICSFNSCYHLSFPSRESSFPYIIAYLRSEKQTDIHTHEAALSTGSFLNCLQ